MTTKQIAEAVGMAEKTVRTWASKVAAKSAVMAAKLAAGSSTHPVDYDLDETCQIISQGLGKNAASLFRENAKQKAPETIAEIVRATITSLLPIIVQAVRGGLPAIEAPMAPALAPRDELRRIVSKAAHDSGDYSGTWGSLYQEIYYRLHINVRERAKNAGAQPIEILESEGLMDGAVAIAREIFG